MASSSNDKAPEPPLQDHKDPATSSDEPPPLPSPLPSSSLQENVQPRDGHSEERVATRRTAAPQSNPPPFLRSGSTTSAAFTSNETTQPSPPPSPAAATAAPVLRLRPNSAPDDNRPDQVEKSWKDLQEKLPSPGTIETQIARVDMHRRSISGESGYLGDQPDPTSPDTPPKPIPPPSESSPRDIPDDYYERKFGILLLRKGHKEFYVVTDQEVFEAWLSTQDNIQKTRPNLRPGESGRIVRYREDYPGLLLGDINPESIGIEFLHSGRGTDYRIIDADKFKAFLARLNLRGEFPTFRLAADGASIRHEDAIVRDEARGILLFGPTGRHPLRQYYAVDNEDLYNAWRSSQNLNGSYPDIPINSRIYTYRPPRTLEIVRDNTQPARRSISFAGERPTTRAPEEPVIDNIRTRPAIVLSSTRRATPPGSPTLRELRENQLLKHEAALSRLRDATDDPPPQPYEETSEHPRNDREDVTQRSRVNVNVSEVGPDDDSPSLAETSEHPRNEGEEVTQQSCEAADVSEVGPDGPNDSNRPAEIDVLDEFEDGDILRRFAELLTGSEVDERRTPPSEVIDRLNATGAQHWDPLQDDDEQDGDDVYSVNG